MATTAATLAIKIVADAKQAAGELRNVGDAAGTFRSGIDKAAKVAAVAGAGLVAFGASAFSAASKAQQSAGAVDTVFGDTAKTVHQFAKTSAQDTGLAASEYETMAATFGAQLKNMGVDGKKLAPVTDDLIGLGADLAAQFGGSSADAVAALSSLLRGETDPIEKYGVSIKQADIAAKKAEMGLSGLTGAADKQATTQATLALLTDQTADATGAFAREANTAAGQQARATAAWDDAQVALGTALLPLVAEAAGLFGTLATTVQENAGVFQVVAAAIGALVAVVLGAKVAMAGYQAVQTIVSAATKIWTAGQWLLNAALSANPIGLVVAAIAALVAGVIIAYKKSDTFRKIVQAMGRAAVTAFRAVVRAVKVVVEWITKTARTLARVLGPAIQVARKIAVTAFKLYTLPIRTVIKVVMALVGVIKRNLSQAITIVKRIAVTAFLAYTFPIRTVIKVIMRLIEWVRTNLPAAFRAARDVIGAVVSAVRNVINTIIARVKAVIDWVRGNLAAAWRTVRDVIGNVVAAIRRIIQTVVTKIATLVTAISTTLDGAFDAVGDTADTVFDAMLAPIGAVEDAIGWVIDQVESLIGWISNISFPEPPGWMKSVGGAIGGLFSLPVPPAPMPGPSVAGLAAPRVAGRSASSSRAPVTINVNGALDPDAVARQIERLLAARSRRVQGVRR